MSCLWCDNFNTNTHTCTLHTLLYGKNYYLYQCTNLRKATQLKSVQMLFAFSSFWFMYIHIHFAIGFSVLHCMMSYLFSYQTLSFSKSFYLHHSFLLFFFCFDTCVSSLSQTPQLHFINWKMRSVCSNRSKVKCINYVPLPFLYITLYHVHDE